MKVLSSRSGRLVMLAAAAAVIYWTLPPQIRERINRSAYNSLNYIKEFFRAISEQTRGNRLNNPGQIPLVGSAPPIVSSSPSRVPTALLPPLTGGAGGPQYMVPSLGTPYNPQNGFQRMSFMLVSGGGVTVPIPLVDNSVNSFLDYMAMVFTGSKDNVSHMDMLSQGARIPFETKTIFDQKFIDDCFPAGLNRVVVIIPRYLVRLSPAALPPTGGAGGPHQGAPVTLPTRQTLPAAPMVGAARGFLPAGYVWNKFKITRQQKDGLDFRPLLRELEKVDEGRIAPGLDDFEGPWETLSAEIHEDYTAEQYRKSRIDAVFGVFRNAVINYPGFDHESTKCAIPAGVLRDSLTPYARFNRAFAYMIASQFSLKTLKEVKELPAIKSYVERGKLCVYHGSKVADALFADKDKENVLQVTRREETYRYLHGGGLYTGSFAVARYYGGDRSGAKALKIQVNMDDEAPIIVVNGQTKHMDLITSIHNFIKPFFDNHCCGISNPLSLLIADKAGKEDITYQHIANAYIRDILQTIDIAGTLITNFEGRGDTEFAFLSHVGSKPEDVQRRDMVTGARGDIIQENVEIIGLHTFTY